MDGPKLQLVDGPKLQYQILIDIPHVHKQPKAQVALKLHPSIDGQIQTKIINQLQKILVKQIYKEKPWLKTLT